MMKNIFLKGGIPLSEYIVLRCILNSIEVPQIVLVDRRIIPDQGVDNKMGWQLVPLFVIHSSTTTQPLCCNTSCRSFHGATLLWYSTSFLV
jgi:hypothetical protein